MSRPLLSRKPDLFITIFFSLHLFFVTCVDCLDLWPTWFSSSPYLPFFALGRYLREFYIETYQDKLVLEQPGWFVVFTWCELLFHVPVCVFVIWGLVKGMYSPTPPSSPGLRLKCGTGLRRPCRLTTRSTWSHFLDRGDLLHDVALCSRDLGVG